MMRHTWLPGIFVFFIFAAVLPAEEKDYYAALAGTREENAVLDFARAEIENSGASVRAADFSGFSGGHSFSYILQTTVPGRLPDTLIVAVPAVSAGNSWGAALALSLWRESRKTAPPVSLLFLFLGGDGETGFHAQGSAEFPRGAPLGTRLFLDSFFSEYPAAVLYLDFREAPRGVVCETGTRGVVAPSWMTSSALAASRESGLALSLQANKNQMHRLGISDSGSPAGEYLAAGLPAIALRNAAAGEPVSPETCAAFFRCFLASLAEGIPAEWDQHYLLLPAGGGFHVIGESVLAVVLLAVMGASILYALAARNRVRRYRKTFLRNFWNLPLILLISAAFFMAGTLFVRLVSALRNTEEIWTYHPFVFFLLKMSSAVFLIVFAFHHLRRLPLSKNGSFYSASAIFFFFANVIVFSVIDIAFSFYFLWAYCAAIFFSLFKKRWVKFLCILIAPLFFYFLAFDTFFAGGDDFAGALIASPVRGNLFLGFMFFPFFLMIIRMDLLFRHPHRTRSGKGVKILLTLSGSLTVVAAAYALVFNPWKNSPQPLTIQESSDAAGTRELHLASPSSLGSFTLRFGASLFPVNADERVLTLPLDAGTDISGIPRTLRREDFPGRRTYTLTLNPHLKPVKMTLRLSSDSPLVIYDVNFPYTLDAEGHHAEVFIGENPPLPLRLILTFPSQQEVKAEFVSWSPELSSPAEPEGKSFSVAGYSKTRDSFILKGDE